MFLSSGNTSETPILLSSVCVCAHASAFTILYIFAPQLNNNNRNTRDMEEINRYRAAPSPTSPRIYLMWLHAIAAAQTYIAAVNRRDVNFSRLLLLITLEIKTQSIRVADQSTGTEFLGGSKTDRDQSK